MDRWGSKPCHGHTFHSSHHVSHFSESPAWMLAVLRRDGKAQLWNIHHAVYIGPGVVRAAIIHASGGTDLVLWAPVSLGVDLTSGWMSSVWSQPPAQLTHNSAANQVSLSPNTTAQSWRDTPFQVSNTFQETFLIDWTTKSYFEIVCSLQKKLEPEIGVNYGIQLEII